MIVTEGFGLAYIPVYVFSYFRKVQLLFWNKSSSLASVKSVSGINFWLKRSILKLYNACLAGGAGQRQYLEAHWVKPEVIFRYLDTIDTEPFKYYANSKRGASASLRMVFIGELIPRKGVDRALRAIARTMSGVEFTVIGSGDDLSKLKTMASDLKLQVKFLGYIDPDVMPAELWKYDVCLVPSWREAWGIVVEEALSAGLYVIADRNVGASERINRRVNGSLFVSEDDLTNEIEWAKNHVLKLRERQISRSKQYCENYNVKIAANSFLLGLKKSMKKLDHEKIY